MTEGDAAHIITQFFFWVYLCICIVDLEGGTLICVHDMYVHDIDLHVLYAHRCAHGFADASLGIAVSLASVVRACRFSWFIIHYSFLFEIKRFDARAVEHRVGRR